MNDEQLLEKIKKYPSLRTFVESIPEGCFTSNQVFYPVFGYCTTCSTHGLKNINFYLGN